MYLCTLKLIGMTGQKTPTALGTEKIGKLLMQYAIPAIIAMTASSLYNMVDSIFIGHGVGAMAISGLALTFPLMNLAAAFGSLVGVGAATLISVKLGQKDYDTAQRVLGNVFVLNIIIGICFYGNCLFLFSILSFIFSGAAMRRWNMPVNLWRLSCWVMWLPILYLGLNAVLRASGHPQKAMYGHYCYGGNQYDYLTPIVYFMASTGESVGRPWLRFLHRSSHWCGSFKLFNNAKNCCTFHKGIFRLKRKIVFDSLAIGMSPFLMNLAACFIVILINQGLKEYGGDLAIGAFGIVNRIVFVFIMIVLGLNQGMQPIAGYNFGAKLYPRVTKVLKANHLLCYCSDNDWFPDRYVHSGNRIFHLYFGRRINRILLLKVFVLWYFSTRLLVFRW